MAYSIEQAGQGRWGAFKTKKAAMTAARIQRDRNKQAGVSGGVRVVKTNPRSRMSSGRMIPVKLIVQGNGVVKVMVSPRHVKQNPDQIDQAFNAGKQWARDAGDSGVANARVRRYGFIKFWNSLPPRVDVTKGKLEKAFNEGYKVGKHPR